MAYSVSFKGNTATLAGTQLKVGDKAVEVELVGGDLSSVKVGGASGKYQIINVVPSLDTGICALQTKRFNKEASHLKNTDVFVVSLDLPFAQGRFCSVEGISNVKALSDFRDKSFGKAYGLVLDSSPLKGLLTRAIIVVDPSGKIIYQDICTEITQEPNYDKVLELFK